MTDVKICGLSTIESLEQAIACHADYVGLVFFPKSPRHVSLEKAKKLADLARDKTKIVALTVDADDELISHINDVVAPDFFQLHGSEDAHRINFIKKLTSKDIIKAFKIREAADIETAKNFPCSGFIPLFDAKAPKDAPLPGGNGETFDWTLLQNWPKDRPFMLSGGLNTTNVAQGIQDTGASMVDVSSGVEAAPGQKSLEKIKSFIQAAKG